KTAAHYHPIPVGFNRFDFVSFWSGEPVVQFERTRAARTNYFQPHTIRGSPTRCRGGKKMIDGGPSSGE
ncbi:hypothetical protein LINGRAPRIM_LOCUS2419, partial [Linum grandiflorum]